MVTNLIIYLHKYSTVSLVGPIQRFIKKTLHKYFDETSNWKTQENLHIREPFTVLNVLSIFMRLIIGKKHYTYLSCLNS